MEQREKRKKRKKSECSSQGLRCSDAVSGSFLHRGDRDPARFRLASHVPERRPAELEELESHGIRWSFQRRDDPGKQGPDKT